MTLRILSKSPTILWKGRPMPDIWRKIHNAANRKVPVFRRAFMDTMDDARESFPVGRVTDFLEMGRTNLAIGLFNTDLVDAAYGRRLMPVIKEMIGIAARVALPTVTEFGKQEPNPLVMPSENPLLIGGFLDLNNPEAIRAAATLGASEVTVIVASTRRALREIVRNAQELGISVPDQAAQIAKELQAGIGLTEPQVVSLNKLKAGWAETGISEAEIARLSERTRKRMIRQRSLVIARNETMEAANAGVNSLWDEAINEGLIPTTVDREWVTQPGLNAQNPCPICRPMDGQRRAMGVPFRSPYNGATALRPPIHVQCMCVTVLVT